MSEAGRFDPDEGVPYGFCLDCDPASHTKQLATKDLTNEHMTTTFAGGNGKGHSVRIVNPERGERISSEVNDLIEEAIQSAVEKVYELIEEGDASLEEVSESMKWHGDFQDTWDEYLEEMS